jgi:dolichol-phosphate mannosyltransferase
VSTEDLVMPLRSRVRHGMRHPANWFELVRFGLVGASGYIVNLVVFTVIVHGFDAGHRVAALGAFLVAVANNFLWNRRWTFRGHTELARRQAVRFLVVSVAAFAVNLAILEVLVSVVGLPEVPAQAIAIAAATPLSFLGNKLWTFGR